MQTTQQPNGAKKVGPIISILVIVLVLIIAALYLFASRISQQPLPTDDTSDVSMAATTTPVQPVTNTSDNVVDMQADLNNSTKGLDNQNF